jgi:two-component system sensor histidine kinase KdpD
LEAEALARSTTSLAADPEPIPRLVEHVRSTFDLDGVLLSARDSSGRITLAEAGDTRSPSTATLKLSSGLKGEPDDERTLEVFGRPLSADDQRLLRILADQLALAIDNKHLASEAGEAAILADVDAVRTALLRAVSHDLRTPLASIKAMVSGLRDPTVAWTGDQIDEALLTVDEETDRLNRLVGNLLDASRLQIGTLAVNIQSANIAEIVAAALHSVNAPNGAVRVEIPPATPLLLCDPTLLERSLANVISNALRHSPVDEPVRIEAAEVAHAVHIRVVDRGVGIKTTERTKVVSPFQRFGDQPNGEGVGLGLSIAQGFVDAMSGTLTLDDTPGGGLTVTIVLPEDVEHTA